MFIGTKSKGDWKDSTSWLQKLFNVSDRLDGLLNQVGMEGVEALRSATPKYTGRASSSWDYKIIRDGKNVTIEWHNFDLEGGYNVVLLVQYGHGTRGGTYVSGVDFINPTIQPLFDKFAEEIYEEVMSL